MRPVPAAASVRVGCSAPSGGAPRFAAKPVNAASMRRYDGRFMEPTIQIPSFPAATFRLPPQLEGLRRLAYNLYWSWHPDAKMLFTRIDQAAWVRYRNPVPVIAGPVPWTTFLENPSFMAEYQDVVAEFDRYLA